jgi:hypothetical protein
VRVTVEGRTDRIDQFFRAIADHDLVVVQSRRHLRFGAISSETFTVSGSSMERFASGLPCACRDA